jgi:nucleotide-binding universal stress UspA family protein
MKLDRVVIGVDFSEPSVAAVHWVRAAVAPGAELVLVHVVDLPKPPAVLRGLYPPADVVEENARTGAEKRLHELRTGLAPGRLWTEIRRGRPSEGIAAVARAYDADLVVIGTHRERPGIRNRLGTTAERLLALSPAPVLLATGARSGQLRNLLVAVDGSPISDRVLSAARDLAATHGARTIVLYVIPSAIPTHLLAQGDQENEGLRLSSRDLEQERVRWTRRLTKAGFDADTVTAEVAFGEAGQETLAAADRRGADLIIVGRSGAGRIRRTLLGSVTREILHDSTRPVLVILERRKGHGREARASNSPGRDSAG